MDFHEGWLAITCHDPTKGRLFHRFYSAKIKPNIKAADFVSKRGRIQTQGNAKQLDRVEKKN